jgi:predicted ATPase
MSNKIEEKKKLSYEELEAYAQQTTARAKQVYEENIKLKQAMQELVSQKNYADVKLAFKVLDHTDKFSPEFVQKVIARLEVILTPQESEEYTIEKPEEGE